jgi:hypothetical protein
MIEVARKVRLVLSFKLERVNVDHGQLSIYSVRAQRPRARGLQASLNSFAPARDSAVCWTHYLQGYGEWYDQKWLLAMTQAAPQCRHAVGV